MRAGRIHRLPVAIGVRVTRSPSPPAFGFGPGQDYVAQFVAHGEDAQVTFRPPNEGATVPAAVTDIYPSGDTLPGNTLRFYIRFSVPMQPHVAFDHLTRDVATNLEPGPALLAGQNYALAVREAGPLPTEQSCCRPSSRRSRSPARFARVQTHASGQPVRSAPERESH